MKSGVAIVGDVHGRADLLDLLLTRLAERADAQDLRVILVGDLVDRGPDSARVLRRVHTLCKYPTPFAQVHALMGNHERMVLDFVQDPRGRGPRWWHGGGEATLASFGLTLPYARRPEPEGAEPLPALRDALVAALGQELLTWLSELPLFWREGPLFVAHAGADPARKLEWQDEARLLWDRKGAEYPPRADGVWVAQGHLIQPEPVIAEGRFMVDTGAWKTGCLSAIVLTEGAPEYVQVRLPDGA